MTRKTYEMTTEQLETLLESMKPVPQIMLQCGPTPSVQERANFAWKLLGEKMGFDYMTVLPTGRGDRFFSAEPLAAHEQNQFAKDAERRAKQEQADG